MSKLSTVSVFAATFVVNAIKDEHNKNPRISDADVAQNILNSLPKVVRERFQMDLNFLYNAVSQYRSDFKNLNLDNAHLHIASYIQASLLNNYQRIKKKKS